MFKEEFQKSYPGIELVSQAASRSLYSPQMRFTTEFEMGRSGATSPLTPGILLNPTLVVVEPRRLHRVVNPLGIPVRTNCNDEW